jgi:hypothetical protein
MTPDASAPEGVFTMRELAADLVRFGRFTPVEPYQRFGYLCGALLILSGLVHGVVYLVDGGPW